ncbi:MAG: tRNA uridine-5-carboxymethylaminomethyl(34) synthesis GTPase MnmE [Thiohalorhabdus sp.]
MDHAQNRLNPRTIAAIATPSGKGGVGVVRVSGTKALAVGQAVSGRRTFSPRYCHYATFRDASGSPLDEGLVIHFPGPHSYTGEDVVEFQGHGGPAVMQGLLQAALDAGGEMAEPGEFTRRAFLNNRLDLSQAESVAALIEADHRTAARAAIRSLEGEFGHLVNGLADELTQLRVFVEGSLDFPDEDIDWLAEAGMLKRVDVLQGQLEALRRRAATGVRLGQGFQVVLAGRPNAGKSSLLNALSGRESAIVTERAGTTRDILRESVEVAGFPVELVDTAGLRQTEDLVEGEGVRRARDLVAHSDLVLFLVDAGHGWTETDDTEWSQLPEDRRAVVWSKVDRGRPATGQTAVSTVSEPGLEPVIQLLRDRLQEGSAGDALAARQRHLDALDRVHGHVVAARRTLADYGSGDLAAQDLLWAQEALGEITGHMHSDELLGRIFATFCIGK